MYIGEVDVRQSELAGLLKVAECLFIKGLAVPDEDPSKDKTNNSQKDTSENTGKNINKRTSVSPPSHRKRQRRVSGDIRNDDSNVKINSLSSNKRPTNSSLVQSQSSKNLIESRIGSDDDLEILPIDQIKREQSEPISSPSRTNDETTNQTGGSSSEVDPLAGSEIDPNDDQTEDIEKLEHDRDEDQIDSYEYSIEAGPSGLQEVGFCILFLLKICNYMHK